MFAATASAAMHCKWKQISKAEEHLQQLHQLLDTEEDQIFDTAEHVQQWQQEV